MIKQFDDDSWYDPEKDQFIFSEQISLSGKPICLTVHVSDACNLRCSYCLSESEQKTPEGLSGGLLDRLKKLSPFKAILSGGEPLILPGIERVIGSLDNSGCSVYVATNGVVSVPQELLTHVDCFDIHIDGTNETVYERSMGKGNFGRVVDNIRMLIAAGAQVRLSCVVNRANYEDAFAFPDFCRLLGVSRLEMIRLLPLGRAKETDLFVDEASMQRLYAEVGNPSDMTIHFMYANIEKTDRWYGDYPVFDSQGNQLKLPGRTFSGTTIFDDDIKETFNRYKQFLYDSPRSMRKGKSDG